MSDFVIRRYQPTDKAQVKKLYELASVASEIGYRSGPWEADFDDIEGHYFNGGEFLVGFVGEEMVALVGFLRISPEVGQLRRMRVHPNHRRKGYAQKMLLELERIARENGVKEMRLKTSTAQKMAQALYEKHAYKKMENIEKSYYTEGPFEAVWYQKIF